MRRWHLEEGGTCAVTRVVTSIVTLAGLISLVALPLAGQVDSSASRVPIEYPVFLTPSLRHGLDTTVSPCIDFDKFANGGWRATAVLPDSVEQFGSWRAALYQTELLLGTLLDSARRVSATTADPRFRVLGQYYESCLRADSLPKRLHGLSMFRALKHDSSRTSRCRRLAMHQLPDALGQVFVQTILTPETETQLQRMVDDIRSEIATRISALPFLSLDARDRTLAALRYMTFKVAKPTDTVDYAGLTLTSTDFNANLRAIQEYTWKYRLIRSDGQQKVFWMDKQYNPNAHFNPANNSIEIPAFLFQWPFFDRHTEAALSYASAGMILGHEILHGVTWKLQSEGNASIFERGQILAPQYSALPRIDSVPVNGKNTVNENLADLGGVLVAYEAWHRSSYAAAAPLLEGFTPEQRFFLYYARFWRSKATRAFLRMQYNMDPHAPDPARINGVVMNVPAFAKAFGCTDGDPMARPAVTRAVIW